MILLYTSTYVGILIILNTLTKKISFSILYLNVIKIFLKKGIKLHEKLIIYIIELYNHPNIVFCKLLINFFKNRVKRK